MKISIIKLVEVVSRYTEVPAVIPLKRPDLQRRHESWRKDEEDGARRARDAAAENYCAFFFPATLVGGHPVRTTNRRRVNTM